MLFFVKVFSALRSFSVPVCDSMNGYIQNMTDAWTMITENVLVQIQLSVGIIKNFKDTIFFSFFSFFFYFASQDVFSGSDLSITDTLDNSL